MHHSSVIIFIAACASAILSSRSQGFSSECPNLTTDIIGCSTQFLQGISTNGTLPDFTKGFASISGSYCQTSAKTAIFDFYECLDGKLRTCLSSDWQKVIPSLDQRKQAFDYMCDNINDVDLTCAETSEKATALVNCLQQGVQAGSNPSTPDEYLAFVCSASQLSEKCAKTAYGSCLKRTAEVLVEADKLARPAGCGASACLPAVSLAFMLALLQ